MSAASNRAALDLIDNGDYLNAYNMLLDENSKHPDDAETLFLLGLCAQSGNIASLYLKDYLQKHPGGEHAVEVRGLLMDYYSSAGLLITAGSLIETSYSVPDMSSSDLYKSALYKQQLGEYSEAMERYGKVMETGDSSIKVWAELGICDCLLLKGNYDSALSGYKELIDNYSESSVFPFALVGISETYRRLGDTDKSGVFYELYRERYEMAPRNIEIEATLLEKRSIGNEQQLKSLIDVEYYIQVGVFARKSNANTCLKKFRNLRHSARIVDFREGGKTFYRIIVGPYSSEKEARREKTDLERSQGEKYILFIQ
ncbi:MAG: SPOR domain-containing protein [Candidatus Zixiibacteriota bacterium]|nr:MAG: SPOR domain-containing protein [candidate division Zixibacteria bacterium]